MPDHIYGIIDEDSRSNWVRLRTLIVLRWIAIIGQLAAIAFATMVYDIRLEFGPVLVVVGAAVVVNLVAIFVYPSTKRLSERAMVGMLLLDTIQLSALLFLAGGLNNPFGLLILVPVTISATTLRPQSTLLVGAAAMLLTTFLALFHMPLQTIDGQILAVPRILMFGTWVAIIIGVMFLGLYAWRVTSEIHSMSEALLATQMAFAREQKLTDLGGVIAAAAHELGTPLATIKLVSTELIDDLADMPDQRDDARLIREQADRCRDILRSMGRAGKDDLLMHHAPLAAVIREAAEPHMERGKQVQIDINPDGSDDRHPHIKRRPEIIHGLRNLVQNAVDFAATTVWIDAHWTDATIVIRIIDDGAGFSQNALARIGEPFMRGRRNDQPRPEYEGMGLGLFIAKTLLERSGAELSFANGSDPHDPARHSSPRSGAIAEVVWPRHVIEDPDISAALGENKPIVA
ncbi:MAG: ActS/PrrB/RegB family redox-sensitive histidine kinase [Paracoccaceae bacterium]